MTSRCLIGAVFAVGLAAPAFAIWPTDPTVNVALCNATGNQGGNGPAVVPSIDGGAIVAWRDERFTDYDIYAQRIAVSGVKLWPGDVPVCVNDRAQTYPAIAADGGGGAFIAWFDPRPPDYLEVWAQYIDSAGAHQWTANGIVLNDTSINSQHTLRGVADGRGGAIFVWEDLRDYATNRKDLYAQRVEDDGPTWTAGGVVISAAAGDQRDPAVGSPRDGSVVIAWRDGRVGESIADIYAVEIVEGTAIVGPPDGLAVSTAPYGQNGPVVGLTGWNEAMIVWNDSRNLATGTDVYAQGVFLTAIFGDGFETGDTTAWSAVAP